MSHTIWGHNGPQAHYKLSGRHAYSSFPIIHDLINVYNSPLVKIFDPSYFLLDARQKNIPSVAMAGKHC